LLTGELRAVALETTYALARQAGIRAGVTRLGDITQFGCPAIPVFHAIRPGSRSLSVSQGKGLCRLAAKTAALLEAAEFHAAEELPPPEALAPLSAFPDELTNWSDSRDPLAISIDPARPRGWLPGENLLTGRAAKLPWDLLSLDFTRVPSEYPATSVGLACGNTRSEALCSGIAELLEHDLQARFARRSPFDKRASQIDLTSIDEPQVLQALHSVAHAGLTLRIWSLGQEVGVAAFRCVLFPRREDVAASTPVLGSGCHPHRSVAILRAILEAVQSRATVVAGARDDLTSDEYRGGGERALAILFDAAAFGEGMLDWRRVPHHRHRSSEQVLDFLLGRTQALAATPVLAFEHEPPVGGLHLIHAMAPGLLDLDRTADPFVAPNVSVAPRERLMASRPVLFAGPSIGVLEVPRTIEVRPPARCGDLAALLDDPPPAVGLVDGYFNLAPTVWHKEIIDLLAAGTRVVGGASLGAIRAAELVDYGMEGVGAIYHAYCKGELVRDDAVMLMHAPERLGYAAITLSLVDAEAALAASGLEGRALRMMQRILRTTPYDRRSWEHCLAEYGRRTGSTLPLNLEWLRSAPSVKRRDAALVVARLLDRAAGPPPTAPPALTNHYLRLLATKAPATFSARTARIRDCALD